MRSFVAFIPVISLCWINPVAAKPVDSGDKAAAVHFWKFANCIAKRDSWLVKELLAVKKDRKLRNRKTDRIVQKNRGCLPGGSQMKITSGTLLRNALAGAYLTGKYEGQPAPDFSSLPIRYRISSLPEGASNKRILRMGIRQFSECVIRKDSGKVMSLLSEKPFSDAENLAIDSLKPEMGQCLPVTRGEKLGFTRMQLRTDLARVAYGLDVRLENVQKMPKTAEAQN